MDPADPLILGRIPSGPEAPMTDWARLVKPSLIGVAPYDPGESLDELKARYGLDEIWKLNWNEDLFGPFDGVLEAVEAELPNAWMYPEQAYADFRAAVATWIGSKPERIVPAHGIQALVAIVAAAFVRPGDRVVVPSPTYGLYAQVSAAAGAEVVHVPVGADLVVDLDALATAARRAEARLAWLADPNNPTGSTVGAGEWEAFLDALPDGCAVVVDEAYREYVAPETLVPRERDVDAGRPVLLLRTFSKIFGLAGLRLGYAVASEELAPFLNVVQEPFNVNRAALAAGRASLRRPDLVEERRATAAAARELLTELLAEAGMTPQPSQANFLLVRLGVDDGAARERVLRRGFLIRAGGEFGLPGYARITVGPEHVMRSFAAELSRVRDDLLGAPTPRR
jgi:histidinol-phosphate aminotransferase